MSHKIQFIAHIHTNSDSCHNSQPKNRFNTIHVLAVTMPFQSLHLLSIEVKIIHITFKIPVNTSYK